MTATSQPRVSVPDLHVGHGLYDGALTLFPIWTSGPDPERRGYTMTDYSAGERDLGPSVPNLTLRATGTLPALVLEGTVLEGGWQHRVLLHSVLMAPGEPLDVDVACVEAGRWHGGAGHRSGRRRAPSAVRGAAYGLRPEDAGRQRPAEARRSDQADVWRRVRYYERTYGPSATSSLVDLSERAEQATATAQRGARGGRQHGLEASNTPAPSPAPLPGQRGVIVGVAGHPLLLELFDDTRSLIEQWEAIIAAARLDAGTVPAAQVTNRRARAFAARITGADTRPVGRQGLADEVIAEDLSLYSARGIAQGGHLLYLSAVNTRHQLTLAA